MNATESSLPKGWVQTVVGEIWRDETSSVDPALSPNEAFDLYSIPAHDEGTFEHLLGREIGSTKKLVAPGTVVLSKINPRISRVGVIGKSRGFRQLGSSEWIPFSPVDGVDPTFLAYALRRESVRTHLAANVSGVGGSLMRTNVAVVKALPLLLPPSREQRRIVEAIESYVSRLDAAVASLEQARARLRAYRSSVLKAAVEGRLVPTEAELARVEKRDYEPADVWLERILAERRRRWEAAELAKRQSAAKVPNDGELKTKKHEPAALSTAALPTLPEGWCWSSLGHMKEFSLYGPRFSSDDYTDGEDAVLVLRTSDISEGGRVNLETPPRLRLSEKDFVRYQARRGDLLITRTGSLGTLAVLDDDVRAIPGAYLIQYRLPGPPETTWFCFHFLKSPTAQAALVGGGKGVGRPNLNVPTIDALPIPIPPVAEQRRIIEEVQRLFSISDSVSDQVDIELRRSARLRQAILRWAFEGKLVEPEPNDEPAEKLLGRIRAERARSAPMRKSRGRVVRAAS